MEHKEAAFYQTECNKRGVRIYPVSYYSSLILEIEFNKSADFKGFSVQKIIRGETRYDPKKQEWAIKIKEKYKQIYDTRILPRLKQGKEVLPGSLRPIYKKTS